MVQQMVEGHWRLDLPEPDTTYSIRCFTDAVSESSTARDYLELAWRSVNSTQHATSTSDSLTGSYDVLYSPCAMLSTTGLDDDASSRRELWVFTPVLDGMAEDSHFLHLQELTPPLQSVCPSTFLLCARGHAACSARCRTSPHWINPTQDTPAARLSRYNQLFMNQDTLSGKITFDVWRRFSQAALNKLAWRYGDQLSLTCMRTNFNPVLMPTADSALVLGTSKPLHLSSTGVMKQRGVQVELVPMCRPALFVAPFSGSMSDRKRLAASLSPYLNHNIGQGGSHDDEDWSIFWVPISRPQQQPALGWDNACGVLGLWPDSLVRWEGKAHPEIGHLSSASAPPPPSVTIVAESLSLFDTIAQAEAATPPLGTPAPPEIMSHDNEGVIAMLVADDSGDDLFSAASSPLPIRSPSEPTMRQCDDSQAALAEDAATSPVESDPDTVADLAPERTGAKLENNEAGIGPITEMDFDFFDAHTPVRPSDEVPSSPLAEIPPLFGSASTPFPLYAQQANARALLVPSSPPEERRVIPETHRSTLAGMTEHTRLPDVLPDAQDRANHEGSVDRDSASLPLECADHFQAINLRGWKYSARYSHVLASSREVARTASQHSNLLVQRLKRDLLQVDSRAPSMAAWNDQSHRRAIPGQSVAITAVSVLSPDTPSSNGLKSPPQSPPNTAQTDGLEDGQHRFFGIRCLTSELVNLEGNSAMTTTDTCPWPALANITGPAAEPPIIAGLISGFPPSPPLSPESSFFAEDDAFLKWLVHEIIWNRHFANHFMPDRLQSAKPEFIRDRLPKPVSLQVMGQYSAAIPPTKIRRRSMSSNRHQPTTPLTPCILRTPKLALGYLGNVVTAGPESLQFWQELGVGPVGGPKDITSFSLFIDDDGSDARNDIDLVTRIGTAYEASKFGVHSAGTIKGDLSYFKSASTASWREAIASIRASSTKTPFAVIFIFLPRLDNGPLLELVSAIHSYLRTVSTVHPPSSIYHMMPPGACRNVRNAPSLALDVYNRCQHNVEAVVSRSQRKPGTAVQYPAFHLASEGPEGWIGSQSTIFKLKWPAATHNVLRSQKTWHCGYRWCPKTEILVAVCLDASGESMDSVTWHLSESNALVDVVSKLYDFCFSTSNGASRLCFCSPEPPPRALLRAWTTFIDNAVPTARIELLCTTTDVSILGNSEDRQEIHAPSTISGSSPKLRAETYAGSAVFLPHRCAIRLPPAAPLGTHADFVFPLASMTLLFAPAQGSSEIPNLGVHVLAIAESEENDLHGYQNEIAESFHNLRILAALRWGCNDIVLPMHLQAVSMVACILAAR